MYTEVSSCRTLKALSFEIFNSISATCRDL